MSVFNKFYTFYATVINIVDITFFFFVYDYYIVPQKLRILFNNVL